MSGGGMGSRIDRLTELLSTEQRRADEVSDRQLGRLIMALAAKVHSGTASNDEAERLRRTEDAIRRVGPEFYHFFREGWYARYEAAYAAEREQDQRPGENEGARQRRLMMQDEAARRSAAPEDDEEVHRHMARLGRPSPRLDGLAEGRDGRPLPRVIRHKPH